MIQRPVSSSQSIFSVPKQSVTPRKERSVPRWTRFRLTEIIVKLNIQGKTMGGGHQAEAKRKSLIVGLQPSYNSLN